METFELQPTTQYTDLNINHSKEYKFSSYEELEKNLKNLRYDSEGYMLFSKDFNDRVKVKGEQYQEVHELKGNQSNKAFSMLENKTVNKPKRKHGNIPL